MSKRNKSRPIRVIHQASVQRLITGLLAHPFDVSMATLIVLCDVDPTISELRVVKDFMSGLTEAEQQFAVMLEASLQANKVNKARMQVAVEAFNAETGSDLRIGDAAQSEDFAAWLPGYNAKLQAEWREANPEEAAAYDRQQALTAQMTQGVGMLQATDPQGDVTPLIPERVAGVTDDAHPDAP